MKKILATIVALCMAISMCVVASAADGASIEFTTQVKESYAKGDTILVPVVLKNADKVTGAKGMAGIELNVQFDDKQVTFLGGETRLEYEFKTLSGTEKVRFDCTAAASPEGSTNSAKFMLDGKAAIDLTGDITLGTIGFTAAADIAEGTEIKATVTVVDACDLDKNKFGDQLAAGEVVLAKAEKAETPSTDPGTSTPSQAGTSTPSQAGTSTPSQAGTSTPSKAGTSTPSKAGTVKPSSTTSTTNPKTGDAGVLAVGALMVVAAGAAFVTMKKR